MEYAGVPVHFQRGSIRWIFQPQVSPCSLQAFIGGKFFHHDFDKKNRRILMPFWDFGIPSWLNLKTHIGNLYWMLNCSWILRLWLDFWDFANCSQAGLFESYPSQFWAFLSLLCTQIVSFFSYIWKGKKGQFLRFLFFLRVKLYASCTRKWALFRGWFRAKFCLPVAAFASSARHCEPGLDSRLRGTRSSLLIFSLGTRFVLLSYFT